MREAPGVAPSPPPMPALPPGRRAARWLARGWPLLVWLGAAAAAAQLYGVEAEQGQMLAYSEVVEVDLTPAVAGSILSSGLEIGAHVETGQPAVRLDPRDVEARLAYAATEVARAERLAEAQRARVRQVGRTGRDGPGACQTDPQRARLELDRLAADQAADRGEVDALDGEITRLRALAEKQLVTAERLEGLGVRRAVLGKRLEAREAQIRALEGCFGATAEEALLAAKERLRLLAREREKHDVLAPVTGEVSEVLHRAGEWVKEGTPIVRVVSPVPNHAVAYVSGRQTPLVEVGTKAVLTPREHAGPALHGSVVAVGPRFEQVPLRLRFIPAIPQWGRIARIELEGRGAPLAGELYNVRFEKQP